MEAKELFLKDGKTSGRFYCNDCKIIHMGKESAESCCLCVDCKAKKSEHCKIRCFDCDCIDDKKRRHRALEKEQVIFDKAELTEDFEYIWYNESMYEDVDEIIDDLTGQGLEFPGYVHPMKPVEFEGFDFSDLTEHYDENEMCEDLECEDKLKGLSEIKAAFKTFNELNKDTVMFYAEDQSKKVKVDHPV